MFLGVIESHFSCDQSKKGMIFPDTYTTIFGVELGAYLAKNDISWDYGLSAKFFDAESSTSGVSTIV